MKSFPSFLLFCRPGTFLRFLILMMAFPFTGFGQDQQAEQILEKLQKELKGLQSLEAQFNLILRNPQGKLMEEKKGSLLLAGDKYRVDLGNQLIISDNKTLWVYLKEMNEVQISPFDPDQGSFSPAQIFSGFWDKDYEASYRGTKTVEGTVCAIVELHSQSATAPFTRIQLAVDKKQGRLVSGQFFDQGGGSFAYTMSSYKPNVKTRSSQFQFQEKDHPGVEVIDLR